MNSNTIQGYSRTTIIGSISSLELLETVFMFGKLALSSKISNPIINKITKSYCPGGPHLLITISIVTLAFSPCQY